MNGINADKQAQSRHAHSARRPQGGRKGLGRGAKGEERQAQDEKHQAQVGLRREETFAERGDYFLDHIQTVVQHGQDRLFIDDLDVVKRYLHGHLDLGIRLGIGVVPVEYYIFCKRSETERTGNFEVSGTVLDNLTEGDINTHVDSKLVFVHDVEGVESIEQIVPSLVWIQRANQVPDFGAKMLLYFSLTRGVFEFLFAPENREVNIGDIRHIVEMCQGGCQIVESGPQVKQDITTQHVDLFGNGFDKFQFDFDPSAIFRIDLRRHRIGITLNPRCEGSVHLVDVLLGPFNL